MGRVRQGIRTLTKQKDYSLNTKKHLSRGAFIVSIALLYMYPINFCVVLQLIVIVVAGRANPCE